MREGLDTGSRVVVEAAEEEACFTKHCASLYRQRFIEK